MRGSTRSFETGYPKLLKRLLAAGARELKFHDSLPASLRTRYRPRANDSDLTILSCRRTTLEAVMRAHVQSLPHVRVVPNARIRGLILDRSADTPIAKGLIVEMNGKRQDALGDIVIDASGRNTPFPDWLAEAGIEIPAEHAPAGIIYYTRHYKLRPGKQEPSRGAWLAPGAGDLGYIKYGVFPADEGHFSITLSVPEIETEIRKAIMRGEIFDRICASFPGVMRWTDPSAPNRQAKCLRWASCKASGANMDRGRYAARLGFFAIGDSTIRTNPLYGRGCSIGFLQGHILARVLRKTRDPCASAKLFAPKRAELRGFYDSMVRQDVAAIRLAERNQEGAQDPRISARAMARSIAEHGVVPAIRRDERVLRFALASLICCKAPDDWYDAAARHLHHHARVGDAAAAQSEVLSRQTGARSARNARACQARI